MTHPDRSLEGWARIIERSGYGPVPASKIKSSTPTGVDGTKKVQGLFPSMTVDEWNAVVDVLTAEELSSCPNEAALTVRNQIRDYLVNSGYRRTNVV